MFSSLYPTPPGTPPNGHAEMGSEEIPMPPGLPIMGNVRDIDPAAPVQSLARMAEQYGDIYRINIIGNRVTVISNNQLINEVCDEKRFRKNINAALTQVRNGVHDGLFTAFGEEEANWGKAHRILTSAFGPLSIRNMYDDMHDIASQLTMKWARMGPNEPIHVTDDFTRLALDTLALCAMDYRFNSFYSAEMHPFVEAMGSFLYQSGQRSRRAPLPAYWYRKIDEKYYADIATMRHVSDGVLKARKEQGGKTERKDLLQAMLNGKDPRTGEKLDDDAITNNLITFLIAGHETTSGMLSFAFYNLIKYPETYRKAQQEVDDIFGTGPITVDQLPKLKYVAAVLRETLRVSSPIPVISMTPLKDETLAGGKYFIPAGQNISLLFFRAHLDPAVFGDDAKEFKPERMLDENFERLNREFPNCWKPFGNGARACIGRPFAWQEALLVMAMLLQSFNFRFDDPSYQLHLKETLTIKPDGFFMRAQLRDGLTATKLERRLNGSASGSAEYGKPDQDPVAALAAAASNLRPMSIYYGSNSGTCEAMANRVGADASRHGFKADIIAPLDNANQSLPTDRPVVIITASYEGQPPDNAGHFISWLTSLKEGEGAKGVSYAVFACGHRDWAQTYHRIPKLIDSQLAACGGQRLAEMGGADASDGNMFEDFEAWEDSVLFPALKAKYGAEDDAAGKSDATGLSVEITTPRASTLRQDVREAVVLATRELNPECTEGGESGRKRHVEIQLPSNMTYTAGDYLAVLPFNNSDAIARAMRRFRLPWDANVMVKTPDGTATTSTQTNLPTNTSLTVYGVIGAYVELGQPATKRNVLSLVDWVDDETTKKALQRLAADDYAAEISAKKVNILDLLDRFPSVDLPFGDFLTLLPPMRVRQYSISSSPLWNPNHVTLSYAVLTAPSLSGNGLHEGVASHYLSSVQPGDRIHVAVRPSHHAFHLPHDAENVPIICVAAGTGLAPFRGFIQERAAMLGAGRTIAPGYLFYGSRSTADDIYRDEFDRWQILGAVDVRRAFSRAQTDAEKTESAGCKYVQDRLWHDRAVMTELWKKGARMYVCGSRQVGEGVKQTVLKIRREWMEADGQPETAEEAEAWFSSIRNERYATDVFD